MFFIHLEISWLTNFVYFSTFKVVFDISYLTTTGLNSYIILSFLKQKMEVKKIWLRCVNKTFNT